VAYSHTRNSDIRSIKNQREPFEVERDPRGPAWDGSITVQNPKTKPLTEEEPAIAEAELDQEAKVRP
jgi:hypothetical protein